MSCVYAIALVLEDREAGLLHPWAVCLAEETAQAALGLAVSDALQKNPGNLVAGYAVSAIHYDDMALILSEQEDA